MIYKMGSVAKLLAFANNLTLVTHNIREFERVEGLQIEDWEVEA
jgi:tRNA(fMet)-specific endonuclease VapC